MAFKITSTNARSAGTRAGFTLVELLFSLGITTMCLAALATFLVFSTHSFATLFNYVDLDDSNRIAMDQLTRDVRQALGVASFTTNSLTLTDSDNLALTYSYDADARTLTRSKENGPTTVLLRECDRLSFVLGQRNPIGGSYDVYPAATDGLTAKVINVSWSCSRKLFGYTEDTESVQTARIVIRKQGS